MVASFPALQPGMRLREKLTAGRSRLCDDRSDRLELAGRNKVCNISSFFSSKRSVKNKNRYDQDD